MEALHEAHVGGIVQRVGQEIREKYEKGQKEHGGNLWNKAGMMPNLREEILDFVVYQDTLAEQLENLLICLKRDHESGDFGQMLKGHVDRLDGILHGRSE